MPTAPCWVRTGKCTSRMTRCSTKKVLLHPRRSRFSGLGHLIRPHRRVDLLGSMVPEAAGSPHSGVRKSCSTRQPSDGTLRKRRSTASISTSLGKPSSDPMPWPTDVLSRRSTGSAWSVRLAVMVSSSGVSLCCGHQRANPGPGQRRKTRKPHRPGGTGKGGCDPDPLAVPP